MAARGIDGERARAAGEMPGRVAESPCEFRRGEVEVDDRGDTEVACLETSLMVVWNGSRPGSARWQRGMDLPMDRSAVGGWPAMVTWIDGGWRNGREPRHRVAA